MKKQSFLASSTVLLLLVTGLGAKELKPIAWSENACSPERFAPHSSGEMTISAAPEENAVRFDVKFKPGTDFWIYPIFPLPEGETLEQVEQIRFEFKAEQADPAGSYRVAFARFNGGQNYSLPMPKPEYQQVTIDLAKAVKNPTEIRDIRIGMNPTTPQLSFSIRNLEFLTSKPLPAELDAANAVRLNAPGSVFLSGEPLKFQLKPTAKVAAHWTLRNWKEEVIQQGEWPGAGKEELILTTLPNGYYKLELNSEATKFTGFRSFAVVPDPAGRPANPDLYFAIDSAQSWLAAPQENNPRQPKNSFEVVSEVARRAGLQMVRERLRWSEVEPKAGNIDWKHYKTNADLLTERGVKISGMYHDAPPWTRKTERLPGDLIAAYRFAKQAAEDFRGQMTNWEFWNEQDIGFAPEAAWDYASAMKAAYLGFKAADADMPVAIGGYALTPLMDYCDVVMASGIGDYFDIFNIHTYRPIRDYSSVLENIREHLARHGASDRPIWFTENGSNMEGAGRLESYMPGLKMHSPDQEMLLAEFIPKMMITMQSLGVARDFFFVLPPYNERGGSKDWGMMRRDFTVKPGYTALATLIDRLGYATLRGETALDDGLKGYLYRQKDGSDTLVFWSTSPIDTEGLQPNLTTENRKEQTFSLPGRNNARKGVDLFGTPFETVGKTVTATRFPAFLDNVTGLTVSKPFVPPKQVAAIEKPGLDKTIVFRTELSEDFTLFVSKDNVDVKKDNAKFKLQVWNLSDQEKTGSITISGGTTRGLPPEITVPAFGKTELELTFTPKLDNEFRSRLVVNGKFSGRDASPHTIPICSLAAMGKHARGVEMPQMLDPANWRKNSAGSMVLNYDSTDESLHFRTRFKPEVDHWTYPEYVLQLPQESLKGALGIRFEVKTSSAAGVRQMLTMLVLGKQTEGGEAIHLRMNNPSEEWEERVVQIPTGIDSGKVEQIRIGLNALIDDITFSIRNVQVIYAP